jgi:hypothetical protein
MGVLGEEFFLENFIGRVLEPLSLKEILEDFFSAMLSVFHL